INQDDLFMVAEDLWEAFTYFKNRATEVGINFYAPTFRRSAGVNFKAPQGFATPPVASPQPESEPVTP
ncbi:MAG: hypothetical protein AAB657_00535, partial [Patescibacteria group bacterium]